MGLLGGGGKSAGGAPKGAGGGPPKGAGGIPPKGAGGPA